MAIIVSKLSSHSKSNNFENDIDATFSWDKKFFSEDYFDIKDFLNFFKVKNFRELQYDCPAEYALFDKEKRRLSAYLSTFSNISDRYFLKYEAVPPSLGLQYLSSLNGLGAAWLTKASSSPIYGRWGRYYSSHRDSFNLLRDMRYNLRIEGDETAQVDLEFAENFRFKSASESFNLFNMHKKLRGCVIPQGEDHFIYMVDFRQFEFRTFLSIVGSDVDFESNDLYADLGRTLGVPNPKISIISYLYSQRNDPKFEKVIKRQLLLDEMREGSFSWGEYPVFFDKNSNYNKKIHSIIQTISYFVYLEKFSNILKLLKGKKSSLIFPLHDAIIFSISKSEIELLEEIPKILVDETYKIKQYAGRNLLEVKEL